MVYYFNAIGYGSSDDDGTGDTTRTFFTKVNNMLTELMTSTGRGLVSAQTRNYVFAGPTSGIPAVPSFRPFDPTVDIPAANPVPVNRGGTGGTDAASARYNLFSAVSGTEGSYVVVSGNDLVASHPDVFGSAGFLPLKYLDAGSLTYTSTTTATISRCLAKDSTGAVDMYNPTGGVLDISTIGLLGCLQSADLVGTVATATNTTVVTGTSTTFLTDFVVGDTITINGKTMIVAVVASDTVINTTYNWGVTNSGATYKRGGLPNGLTQMTGTVSTTAAAATLVTGSGTSFNTEFATGDYVTIWGTTRTVSTVTTATAMVLTSAFGTVLNDGITTAREVNKGSFVPFNLYIYQVSNGTSSSFVMSTRSTVAFGSGVSAALVDLPEGYTYYRQLPYDLTFLRDNKISPFTISGNCVRYLYSSRILHDTALSGSLVSYSIGGMGKIAAVAETSISWISGTTSMYSAASDSISYYQYLSVYGNFSGWLSNHTTLGDGIVQYKYAASALTINANFMAKYINTNLFY